MMIPPHMGARALCALALLYFFLIAPHRQTAVLASPQTTTTSPNSSPVSTGEPWAMVLADSTPILRKVENSADAITNFLYARSLVSRLPATGKPQTLTLKTSMLNRPAITGSGVLVPVRINFNAEKALAFENTLGNPPVAVPSRDVLCARIGADAGVPAGECAQVAVFVLGPGAKPAAIAAIIQQSPDSGRLFWVPLNDAAKTQIAVTSFDFRGWFALEKGYSVILGEQYRRKGNLTGFALTPIVVAPDGRLSGGGEVMIKSAEPTGGVSTIVEGRYQVAPGTPFRAVIELDEEIKDIKTGATKSKRSRTAELRWHAAAARFEVASGK